MRRLIPVVTSVAIFALGYLTGVTGFLTPNSLRAQVSPAEDFTGQTREKLDDAYENVRTAAELLKQGQREDGKSRYEPATKGVNFFAVSVGGINAKDDLEKGRGVDPETFAALYAEQAVDEVAEHLDNDDEGRLTYKGKVVRMYPISRLKELYQLRLALSGDTAEP